MELSADIRVIISETDRPVVRRQAEDGAVVIYPGAGDDVSLVMEEDVARSWCSQLGLELDEIEPWEEPAPPWAVAN